MLVELHGMLLGLWVRGEPHQRDTLVDLDYSGVQRGRAPYVEVKDLGAGLVANQQDIFESFGYKEGVLVALAL